MLDHVFSKFVATAPPCLIVEVAFRIERERRSSSSRPCKVEHLRTVHGLTSGAPRLKPPRRSVLATQMGSAGIGASIYRLHHVARRSPTSEDRSRSGARTGRTCRAISPCLTNLAILHCDIASRGASTPSPKPTGIYARPWPQDDLLARSSDQDSRPNGCSGHATATPRRLCSDHRRRSTFPLANGRAIASFRFALHDPSKRLGDTLQP